ncbi:MAG: Ig-like domain-containing protein, partial [Vicinamibacterales bacterium]
MKGQPVLEAGKHLNFVGPAAVATTFSNSAPITTVLPPTCVSPPQPSTPYPSNITVSGLSGTVSDVNVTLHGMNFFEGDFEILLVGPGGGSQNLVLLSDAGSVDVSNFTLIFDDAAASALPQNGSWGASPRTAKPTDYAELSSTDTFPSPAPAPANRPAPTGSATLASVFNGIAPNGTWSLYVITDVCNAPAETITGGWSVDITTAAGAATTTVVTSSQNPSITGSSVTFTATATSGGSAVTTGTVTFTEGATTLAANVPVNGSGQASFSTSTLPEGNHIITATYNGTASFNTSNGSVNQRVNNQTVVQTDVNGTTYCNMGPIAINANPNPATPYPSNILVTGQPAGLGKVTVTLKNITHQFADDIDILLVGPAGQNLVLLSDASGSPPPAYATSNVTVTLDDAAANLAPATGPLGAANSSVTYKPTDYDPAGQVDVFAAPAPAPSAATTLATFNGTNPNGTWSLYVLSDGAPDTGSIAGGWCITLTKAATTSTITADTPAPTVTGQGYMVSFSVTSGLGTPTGTVTVSDGTNTCMGTLSSGTGSCTLTSFTAGAKTLRATYSGDANFNSSTSAGVSHTVNKANTTTTITNAATLASTPTVVGQSYAVNWSVTVNAPGSLGVALTGNVTVDAGGGNTCTAAVSAGTCNVISTTLGLKSITATYAGDANYNGSASVAASHTVNKADTTTTITNAATLASTPTVVGQAYAVNWSVTVNAPGALGAALTGNVTVSDGTDSCTAAVSAGTCMLTSTMTGAKTITATYAGDTNYNGSSGTASHTVNKPGTTTTITSDMPDPSVAGQAYNVAVSVAPTPPGMGMPTGTVNVSDGTGGTCVITLSGGSGTCNLTSTTVGAKTIT